MHFQSNRSQKVVKFARITIGHELDTAIGKVTDVARHIEATGQVLASDAETHTLHPAREVDSATNQRHATPPAASGTQPMRSACRAPALGQKLGLSIQKPASEQFERGSQANGDGLTTSILAVDGGARQVVIRAGRTIRCGR
jgi:hypothetical protein